MGEIRAKPIDSKLVKELFNYVDGELIWKVDKGRAKIGMKAHTNSTGYKTFKLNGKQHLEHRLIWAWHYGDNVPNVIDHINGDFLDNRIENLREATQAQNMYNRKLGSNNKSGVKGVYRGRNKWRAQITVDGRIKYLGSYDSLSEAESVVCKARNELHCNFANNGEL